MYPNRCVRRMSGQRQKCKAHHESGSQRFHAGGESTMSSPIPRRTRIAQMCRLTRTSRARSRGKPLASCGRASSCKGLRRTDHGAILTVNPERFTRILWLFETHALFLLAMPSEKTVKTRPKPRDASRQRKNSHTAHDTGHHYSGQRAKILEHAKTTWCR